MQDVTEAAASIPPEIVELELSTDGEPNSVENGNGKNKAKEGKGSGKVKSAAYSAAAK
jgi:hypothetical protein